jgi:outer membrane protein assembly factor BamE (lipoprotein component of BamABCDE complex)
MAKAGSKVGAAALLALTGVVGLSGCVSVRTSHGYVLERGETEIKAEAGVDTKESMLAKYGEPSTKGAFDENYWYNFAAQDAARAFFKPRTTTRAVVAIKFRDDGFVEEARLLSVEDGYKVHAVNKTTPSRGKELSFWEQLLGNVGQLPTAQPGQTPGGGGPGGPN